VVFKWIKMEFFFLLSVASLVFPFTHF